MTTQKNKKSKKSNNGFRKTRSKRQRGGNKQEDLNRELLNESENAPPNDDAVEKITELLENGANVNVTDSDGKTPLILAVENVGDPEDEVDDTDWIEYKIVKLLLKHGADITAKDNEKYTAVYLTQNTKIRKLLIDKLFRQNDVYYKYPHQMIYDLKLRKIDPKIFENLVKEIRDKITIEKQRKKDKQNLRALQESIGMNKSTAPYVVKHRLMTKPGQGPTIAQYLGGKRKTRKLRKQKTKKSMKI